jgi:unsaturated chondroitin disaccharide hydrolase
MVELDYDLTASDLRGAVQKLFQLAGTKLGRIRESWDPRQGTPVFTSAGRYTSRGWTEWTQGFLFGIAILHFDATGSESSLAYGRDGTVASMAPHVSHIGVHDHGFNNVSTYGNLLRLMEEGRLSEESGNREESWEKRYLILALEVSGAVQASRWTDLPGNLGYIYSFNGPHSLFIDTIRTLRVLALSYKLGHVLMGEQDQRISLLERLLRHSITTSRYSVYHGTGRDSYDIKGRVSHEAIFNIKSGTYRCPSTQQGYSPFSTWTRGLAWAICGFAELLEFLVTLKEETFEGLAVDDLNGKQAILAELETACEEVAEFYLSWTPIDGIPYWDTGAPGLVHLPDYLDRPADPYNPCEPVDSSAAAIAAQGFIRLGRYMEAIGNREKARRYLQAGLVVARSLLNEPYLSTDPNHQGLILHSIYHRPNGWDYTPPGRETPSGESSLWGDYHAMELAVLLQRMADGAYFTFFDPVCET